MGCNGIHMIDLLAYLTNDAQGYVFSPDELDEGFIESKRGGYIEFTGSLRGKSQSCHSISLTCLKGPVQPVSITLAGNGIKCEIDEATGRASIARESSNEPPSAISFSLPYTSQSTKVIIEQLADTGQCSLPDFDESAKLHIPLLKAFLQHLNKHSQSEVTVCPIT